ncbi:unnamed protein product [Cunninghamella echinulata]
MFGAWFKYYRELQESMNMVDYNEPEVPLSQLLSRVSSFQELPETWSGEINCGHDATCLKAVRALVRLYYLVYGRWLDMNRVSVGMKELDGDKCVCKHLSDMVSDMSDIELARGGNGKVMDWLFKLAVAERNGSMRSSIPIEKFGTKIGAQIKHRWIKELLEWYKKLQDREEYYNKKGYIKRHLWKSIRGILWIRLGVMIMLLHPKYSYRSIRRATDVSTLLSCIFMLCLIAACTSAQMTFDHTWHRGHSSWANGTGPVLQTGESHSACGLKHQWWEYDVVLVGTDKEFVEQNYNESILLKPGGPYSYCHDHDVLNWKTCEFPETIGDMLNSKFTGDWACGMVAGARNVRENQIWISWRADLVSTLVFGIVFVFELGRIFLLTRLKAGQGSLFSYSFIVRSSQAIAEAFAWNSSKGLDLPSCTLCGNCPIVPWPRVEYADGATWHYFCKVGKNKIESVEAGRFAVDARPRIVFKKGLRYREGRIGAVSHAWEDGLISELGARECIYDRLVSQSHELGLDYLWIDAANLGPNGIVKSWRLTEMGLVYSAASIVLVVSKDVIHSGVEVLTNSKWSSRVWTTQEWLSASSLYCLGKSGILDGSDALNKLMVSTGYQLGEDASCIKVLAKKEGYRRKEQGFILWALIGQKTNRRSLNYALLLFTAFSYLAGLALVSFTFQRNEISLMYATPFIVVGFLLNEEVRGRMYQPEKFSRLQLPDVLKRMNSVPSGVINAAGPRAKTFGHCWVPTDTALQCIGVGQRIKVSDFGLVLNRWKTLGDCLVVAPGEFVTVFSSDKLMDRVSKHTVWLWWIGEFLVWLIGAMFLFFSGVVIREPRNGHVIGRRQLTGDKGPYRLVNMNLGLSSQQLLNIKN